MVASSFSDAPVGVDSLAQLPGAVSLPPIHTEAFVSQRHEVNPALALNLLNDIRVEILQWQAQLRKVVQALRLLHAQGPMVEGWLESSIEASAGSSSSEVALLRHGEADALMQYVESLDPHVQPPVAQPSVHQPIDLGAAGNRPVAEYRLCQLDENGQVRSQPCPPEQMGMVSIAIVRYQKFKQLLDQKTTLEAKLKQAVDQLTTVRASL